MTGDFRATVLLDELNSVEARMEPLRPKLKRILRDVLFNAAVVTGFGFSDVRWDIAWVLISVLLVATVVGYLPSHFKLRTLEREREKLLERGGLVGREGNHIL